MFTAYILPRTRCILLQLKFRDWIKFILDCTICVIPIFQFAGKMWHRDTVSYGTWAHVGFSYAPAVCKWTFLPRRALAQITSASREIDRESSSSSPAHLPPRKAAWSAYQQQCCHFQCQRHDRSWVWRNWELKVNGVEVGGRRCWSLRKLCWMLQNHLWRKGCRLLKHSDPTSRPFIQIEYTPFAFSMDNGKEKLTSSVFSACGERVGFHVN